jgi:hypothetical protein
MGVAVKRRQAEPLFFCLVLPACGCLFRFESNAKLRPGISDVGKWAHVLTENRRYPMRGSVGGRVRVGLRKTKFCEIDDGESTPSHGRPDASGRNPLPLFRIPKASPTQEASHGE